MRLFHDWTRWATVAVFSGVAAVATAQQQLCEPIIEVQSPPTLSRIDCGSICEPIPCGGGREYRVDFWVRVTAGNPLRIQEGVPLWVEINVFDFDGYPLSRGEFIGRYWMPGQVLGVVGGTPRSGCGLSAPAEVRLLAAGPQPPNGDPFGSLFYRPIRFECRDPGTGCAIGSFTNPSPPGTTPGTIQLDPDRDGINAVYIEVRSIRTIVEFNPGAVYGTSLPATGLFRSFAFPIGCRPTSSGVLFASTSAAVSWNAANRTGVSFVIDNNGSDEFDEATFPLAVSAADVSIVGASSPTCDDVVLETTADGDPLLLVQNENEGCDFPLTIELELERAGDASSDGRVFTVSSAASAGARVTSQRGRPLTLGDLAVAVQAIQPASEPAVIDETAITITPFENEPDAAAIVAGGPGAVTMGYDGLLTSPPILVQLIQPPALGEIDPTVVLFGSGTVEPDGSFTVTIPGDSASYSTDLIARIAVVDQFGGGSNQRTIPLPDFCPGDLNRDGGKDAFDVGDALDLISEDCPTTQP